MMFKRKLTNKGFMVAIGLFLVGAHILRDSQSIAVVGTVSLFMGMLVLLIADNAV